MKFWDLDQLSAAQINQTIESGEGFILSSLSLDERNEILALVRDQYLHTIQSVAPSRVADYHANCMTQYHKVFDKEHFDHASVWSKPARILGPKACLDILKLGFIDTLKNVVGDFEVSDEENFGWSGIYWRLVRPGNADVGPIHADKWFWDLGHGEISKGYKRLKLWICLHAQKGKSGLRVVPSSQLKDDWKYHGEERNGIIKPVLDEKEADLNLVDLPLSDGQFVLFHDKLLHGGMPNVGDNSRVSIEFTLVVPE